jgi:membrane associated rhomboid family serine protease
LLLFIPIRTDSPVRRRPRVNHLLILLNVLIYVGTDVVGAAMGWTSDDSVKRRFMLSSVSPDLYRFLTYQFLHADFWHLFGNMLFLWVFGNSVNSKMGDLAYAFFYLAGGVFSAVGFSLASEGNLIGASGAIAGVTTAYLVLFPRSEVTVFYWLWFYLGTMHIQALLLIGLKIILWDNVLAPRLTAGAELESVAYSAHLGGYLFGFVVCALLLLVRAIPRDHYDIIALIQRYRRRQVFRSMMADPEAQARATYGRVARPVAFGKARPIEDVAPEQLDAVGRLRVEIGELLTRNDFTTAADRYEELVAIAPEQCLSRKQMLLVANQLMSLQRYPQAAAAYEKFLKAYPSDVDVIQVKLLLGIIYARYMAQYQAAQKHLSDCLPRLTDPLQIQQAGEWLATASTALGQGPAPSAG